MRGGKAGAAHRRGPVALSMVAGVAAGLLVATWVFAGKHHAALPGGGAGGSTTATAITTAGDALASLRAEVQRLTAELDAAQNEAANLRAGAAAGGAAGAAAGAAVGAAAGAAGAAGTCPDRHTPWGPSPERDKLYPELAEFLKKVGGRWAAGRRCRGCWRSAAGHEQRPACIICFFCNLLPPPQVAINNEVLVAVSNKNYAWPGGMLSVWAENAKRAGGCRAGR